MKNSFSGNYFATAANLLGSSIKKGRIINLLRLTHEGAALLVKLFLLLKKEKIDVIHTHLFYAFIFGGLTGKLLKIPVVYSVPAMKSQMDGPFPWVFPMYRRLGFLIDTFMTGISKEELTAHGVPLKKIVLFHGSINLDKITQTRRDSNPIIERYGLEDSYPILLSVGRFDPSKGHQHSLEAVAKLKEKFPSIKLIILGEGLEYEKYLDIVEKDVSLTDIVTLPGFVKDPGPFYSAADIYLRTTLYEGMNRAGYLAMAYSKPVVGFDTRAPTEAVVDGENGLLVPVGDTEELAESISRLAADKALQKKLGSGALWYIVENQNISSAINAFEQAYSKLVRGGYNK
jgi:glycosyltransferase involved in cell wall biosynthesis